MQEFVAMEESPCLCSHTLKQLASAVQLSAHFQYDKLMPRTKWPTTFVLRMQLLPTLQSPSSFHLGCSDGLSEEVVNKGVLLRSQLVTISQAVSCKKEQH